MQKLKFVDVDYCQFSDWGYQKPTRIWCSSQIAELPSRKCDLKTCDNMTATGVGGMRHFEQLGCSHIKIQRLDKYRMPTSLIDYLLSVCKENMPNLDIQHHYVLPIMDA